MSVLIIHNGPNGHQKQDLEDHGGGTAQAATQRAFQRATKVEIDVVGFEPSFDEKADKGFACNDCQCPPEETVLAGGLLVGFY